MGSDMPFTEEEFRRWHEEKRKREYRPPSPWLDRERPVATCIHCQLPFGISEGVITEDVAICDRCNG
jgi:hypothetical protein